MRVPLESPAHPHLLVVALNACGRKLGREETNWQALRPPIRMLPHALAGAPG